MSFISQPAGGGGGSSAWGAITGTLSSQTDLQSALDGKTAAQSLSEVLAIGADGNAVDQTNLGNLILAAGKMIDLSANGAFIDLPSGTSPNNPAEDIPVGFVVVKRGGAQVAIPYYALSV